jgi:hypothetical protein
MAVKLVYQLVQHSRDEQLMKSFLEYFDCGLLVKDRDAFYYRVSKLSDLCEKIIPFFNKYQIQGVKHLDYLDGCKVAELMKNRVHRTEQGLKQIRQIKAGINKGRTVLNSDNILSPNKSSRRFYSVCTNLSKEYTTPEIYP